MTFSHIASLQMGTPTFSLLRANVLLRLSWFSSSFSVLAFAYERVSIKMQNVVKLRGNDLKCQVALKCQ